jgi:hypothetical protein
MGYKAPGGGNIPHGARRLLGRAELLLQRGAQLAERLDLRVGARGRVELVDEVLPLGHQRSRERSQRRVLLRAPEGASSATGITRV